MDDYEFCMWLVMISLEWSGNIYLGGYIVIVCRDRYDEKLMMMVHDY